METKNKNKFTIFFKNYGTILVSSVLIVAIAITLLIVGLSPTPMDVGGDGGQRFHKPCSPSGDTKSIARKRGAAQGFMLQPPSKNVRRRTVSPHGPHPWGGCRRRTGARPCAGGRERPPEGPPGAPGSFH